MRTAKKKIGILDEGVLLTDDVDSIDFTGTGITGTIINRDVTEAINSGTTAAGWTTNGSTKTTTSYNVGIGASATTPRGLFDVYNTASALQAPATGAVDFNDGTENPTGNYTLNGDTYAFRIYPYKTINAIKYIGSIYLEISAADPNTAAPGTIDPFWDSVTGADGYRVFFSDPIYLGTDFSGNWAYVDTSATVLHFGGDITFQEDNMTGFSLDVTPTASFPDFYIDSLTGVISNSTNSFNFSGSVTASSFSGSGASLTGLNASNIATGTLSVARGGTGASTLGSTQVLVGNGTSAVTSSSGFTFNTSTGQVTINNGASTSVAMSITGTNFTRFQVVNTNASGSGSLYSIASFNMQSTTHYVQFATYGNGTNNGTRWGASLNGVAELIAVSLGGMTSMVIGTYDNLPLIFGTQQTERFRLTGNTLSFSEGHNFVLGTSTGTKIGTTTSQKLGFFNATPIVQVGATIEIGVALSNLGLRAAGTAYPITTSGAITLGSLTSTRVPIAGTAGLLGDDADLTFTGGDTLNATKLVSSTSVSTPLMISTGVVRLKNYTVATLPAGTQGDKAFVTDALGPTYLVTVVGGGAVITEVFYNGTNWVCT